LETYAAASTAGYEARRMRQVDDSELRARVREDDYRDSERQDFVHITGTTPRDRQ
jgi:hypothetical protein